VAETKPSDTLKRKRGKGRDFELESRKHLLVLVIKLLHELQHAATWLLFDLFPAVNLAEHTQTFPPADLCRFHVLQFVFG
jgi:hypothetical protein